MSSPTHAASSSQRLGAWLVRAQNSIRQNLRPYHLAVAAAAGLITVIFAGVIGILILIASNFNVLGWME